MSANVAQVVATASVSVNTEAYGSLRIVKKGDNGSLLSGVRFGIYSDHECRNLIKEVTTGKSGFASATDLPVGLVYVKELSTVAPYCIDDTVYTVEIPLNDTVEIEIVNESAKGRLRIEKTGEVMTSVISTLTDWGNANAPVYTVEGLAGAVFEIRDSNKNVVATLTTDEYGVAESDYLEFGDYIGEQHLLSVRPCGIHCIEGVRNCDDLCHIGYIIALEPAGIALSVDPLMVAACTDCKILHHGDVLEKLLALCSV